jgi:2-oxoglutarate ferredoxin oxidoreductase subunit beta
MNKRSKGIDEMHYYQEKSIVRNGADPRDAEITLGGPIVVGKFVDIERTTFGERQKKLLDKVHEKKQA